MRRHVDERRWRLVNLLQDELAWWLASTTAVVSADAKRPWSEVEPLAQRAKKAWSAVGPAGQREVEKCERFLASKGMHR